MPRQERPKMMFYAKSIQPDQTLPSQRRWRCESGFTTVEMIVICVIMAITIGTALLIAGNTLPTLRADSSLDLVVTQLRQAREQAMDERRNFIVTFNGTNEIKVQRQELPLSSPTYTLIADVFLGQRMIYTVPSGLTQDTPDQFDSSLTAVCFGNPCSGTSITFQGDGTAVTTVGGSPVNGTVFTAIPGKLPTARAVTVLGATGQIQGYRYNGSAWGQ
jgi:type II secretory pathway pseudopilin PulG